MNALNTSCTAQRDSGDADLIDELAEHLFTGPQDVSDPEACFRFLLELDVCRPIKLCGLLDRTIEKAGRKIIERGRT